MNLNALNNAAGLLPPRLRKILLVMKITTLILLSCLLQVSASSFGQRITLDKKNVELESVLKEIRNQSGYNFIYNADLLEKAHAVTVKVNNATVEAVLTEILKNQHLSFEIKDRTIILEKKEPTFLDRLAERWAAIDVRGTVVDDKGLPLPGATVMVKGNGKKVSANSKGEFYLQSVEEKAVLVLSYLGYESREVKAEQDMGSIQLILADGELDEVTINAGYYRVTDRERTGSISRVTAANIEKQPVNNPLMALQNRVAGLEISQSTGVPGGGFRVQIRGRNSMSNGNDPLYIIDGVIYPSTKMNTDNSDFILGGGANPLSLINSGDIESIEVLKDADATAIYGSRGANGVILISTKKGSNDKLSIDASISKGFSQVGHKMDLLNTEQYLEMRMEAFKNDGLTPSATDYDVNGVWDQNKYTDWQKELIGGKADITNAALSVSGGNDKSNYLISGNYYNEGTVFPGSFGFKRGGLHFSINLGSAKKKFSANFTASYSQSVSDLPSNEPTSLIILAPNAPDVYDQYGKLNWMYNNISIPLNPMATLFNTVNINAENLVANVNLNWRIAKNLVLKGLIGYTTVKTEELAKRPNAALDPSSNPPSTSRSSKFGNNYNNSWVAEPQLSYNVKLGKGKINSLLGMSFQQNKAQYRNILASNFNSDDVMEDIRSATVFSIDQSSFKTYKYAALFARINYSLSDKYYLNITARRDASSRFGPGNQFANFGAVGAAWIFSEENLIKDKLPFLSFGKLRTSYGITGNDQIDDYGYLQLYNSSSSYQGFPTLVTSRIANPDYSWETNKKAEVALQLGFLDDKVNLQIAHFRNRSSNQLVSLPLAPSVGASAIQANLPAKVQNTGWEFESTFRWLNHKDLTWQTNFNLTIPKNKLVSFPDFANSPLANVISGRQFILGQSLTNRRYYNSTVDLNKGIYVLEDKDGNGKIDNADLYLNKFIGQIFYGGVQNSISYKGVNLDFLISFNKLTGSNLLSGLNGAPGTFSFGQSNKPSIILNRWQKPGDQSDVPKFTTLAAGRTNYGLGTGENGRLSFSDDSYIRLKNIALSYNIPTRLVKHINIENLQLNIQGQNVFTFTKYEGLDPENQMFNRLPPLRTFSIGLKLTL